MGRLPETRPSMKRKIKRLERLESARTNSSAFTNTGMVPTSDGTTTVTGGLQATAVGPDGVPYVTMSTGVGSGAYTATDADGNALGGVNPDGSANLSALAVTGTDTDGDGSPDAGCIIYGRDFTDWMDNPPGGVKVAGSYNASIAAGNVYTPYGIGEVSFTQQAGREYLVRFGGTNVYGTAGTRALIRMVYTNDGSTPTINSPCLDANFVYIGLSGSAPMFTGTLEAEGNFGPDGALIRVLITIEGVNAVNIGYSSYPGTRFAKPFRLNVYDVGPEVPDTYIANDGGGVLGSPTGGTSSVTPPPAKKNYTSIWWATGSASYDSSGNDTGKADMMQGYLDSQYGNQHSMAVFATTAASGETAYTIAQALSGATLTGAWVYLDATHWWYNSGGTAIVRPYNSTTLQGTNPGGSYVAQNYSGTGGIWVNITSLATTAIRGVTLGQGLSTSLAYYGRFAGATAAYTAKPKLKLTYTR